MVITRKNKREWQVCISPRLAKGDTYLQEVLEWCNKRYGPGGRHTKTRWRYGWTNVDNCFYFKTEKDANWFVLRWS